MPYLYLARVPDGLEIKNPAHSLITGRKGGEFGGLGHHRDTTPQPWAMSFYPPGYAVQAVKSLVAPVELTRGGDAADPGWGTGVTAVEG